MKNSFIKLVAPIATGLAVAALLTTSALAQVGPEQAPKPPCDASNQTVNARVSITREQVTYDRASPVTNYYEGWNGNCWNSSEDAYQLDALGSGAVTWRISLHDAQNLGLSFSDATGICEPSSNPDDPQPNAQLAVVFGTYNADGSVKLPLSTWPIPGIAGPEQAEFGDFEFDSDGSILTFTDRDNDQADYFFGVYVCDPNSPAFGGDGAYVFVADPGREGRETGTK